MPRKISLILTLILAFTAKATQAQSTLALSRYQSITYELFSRGHYLKDEKFRNVPALSRQVFARYLRMLDPDKIFFLQSDIDGFEKDGLFGRLQKEVQYGLLKLAALEAGHRAKVRAQESGKLLKHYLEAVQNFEDDEKFSPGESTAWPADEVAREQRIRQLVEREMLSYTLAYEKVDAVVRRKISRQLLSLPERTQLMQDSEFVYQYLNAFALELEPHAAYLGAAEMESFVSALGQTRVGIGIRVKLEGAWIVVEDVREDSSAAASQKIKVGDRVIALAEGETNEVFTDVAALNLEQFSARVKGKAGTWLRLKVLPSDIDDLAQAQVVKLQRVEEKMGSKGRASAYLVEDKTANGQTVKIGVIDLPMFYSPYREGEGPTASGDVRILLEQLKKEGVSAIVLDMDRNGGGSLDEAIRLTGLFIKEGAVTLVKAGNGRRDVLLDQDEGATVWDGPLVVKVSMASASATEIVAANLQDRGRALIVGDARTFGKGTVQTVVPLEKFFDFVPRQGLKDEEIEKSGELKFTVQTFYRITGETTQGHGVSSDVVLPSAYGNAEMGERFLANSISPGKIAPEMTPKILARDMVARLKFQSRERVTKEDEFRYIAERVKLLDELRLTEDSLNMAVRAVNERKDLEFHQRVTAERKVRGPMLGTWTASQLNMKDVEAKKAFTQGKKLTGSIGASKRYFDARFREVLDVTKDYVAELKLPLPAHEARQPLAGTARP